ncbi:phosphoglycerate mutase [Pseudomarimonas salicorniae]|uniref:Phosphoglycerate mutase n=1 Tax=Pseudomarimonas salicorniae TaxID=2933270 RepID=A0ABT0GHT1_9GAMM|nr:phosphoglycerate mutase [Lysobacter sp. CAU 1642]MCK7594112.1 phosphoglycerate mutase [Lysobacter sp. CAU 1642]
MAQGERSVTVLLPALDALRGGLSGAPRLARTLGRADALDGAASGRDAQLLRHLRVLPTRLPTAPLTRMLDGQDAGLGSWVRADPAHVRADMSTARMLAHGPALELTAAEAEALVLPLRPLFGDFGMPISTPRPERWYVHLSGTVSLPAMVPPEIAVGRDLLECLPPGPQGARWRQLWNEAQVVLHNHEINRKRAESGKPPVNSLWFWGGGSLPDSVQADASGIVTLDPVLKGLARLGEIPEVAASEAWVPGTLVDLSHLRDAGDLEGGILDEVQSALRGGGLDEVLLDFANGRRWLLRSGQRWRFWRAPLKA